MMRLPVTNLPPAIVVPDVQRRDAPRPVTVRPRSHERPRPLPVVPAAPPASGSFYQSLLRLHRFRPTGLQRILFLEGSVVVGTVLALADVASAWIIPVLPAAVAVVVKFEDVVASALARSES